MPRCIESDKDLPRSLSTDAKQAKKAKALASAHLGVGAKKTRGPHHQGLFSRTLLVTMSDDSDAVIQFRMEPLDISCFKQARQFFGSIVPDIEILRDQELSDVGVCVYYMTCIPGRMWLELYRQKSWDSQLNVSAMKSLGIIFSRGFVSSDSSAIVENYLKPKLKRLLISEHEEVKKYRDTLERLLRDSDQLNELPLWISHADLNHLNVFLHEDGEVAGIVDWELSENLPFGIGLRRIFDLAGRYRNRMFHQPAEFEDAERAFWTALMGNLSMDIRQNLLDNKERIQLAFHVSILLDAFPEDAETYNPAALNSLPLFLTYRPPMCREDSAPPFQE